MPPIPDLVAATAAMQRGAWPEAKDLLQASLAVHETPEALEQLGLTAWWLDDATLTFSSRERAFNLYRDQGDPTGAARVALWLVWDCLAFRGDTAVSSGWMERARRLLTGHESSPEFGWLQLREGEVALFRGHDTKKARALGLRAAELGRATGDTGLEFTGLALEGLARVSAGDVAAGMRCLDEATAAATAGEVKELHTVGVVCCWQIFACERVRDYDRAAQWCARAEEFTKRWPLRPFSAICRSQYAGVLIWRGEWAAAEAALATAARDFEQTRPPLVGQALVRLGELRLRQGKLEEAAKLFEQAGEQPRAKLGRAALDLERGAADECAALLERFLTAIGDGEPTLRAGALELAAHAHVARGDERAAEHALDELRRIAKALGTTPLDASVASAEGALLRLRGDANGAVGRFEAAVSGYDKSGAPLETARARLDLAGALAATRQSDGAEREARRALETFTRLGALRDVARAKAWLERGKSGLALTGRQQEILRLVAQGLTNTEIAARLKLSDHTVKRHVANLLTKLKLPSRAAAAAYAGRQGLL